MLISLCSDIAYQVKHSSAYTSIQHLHGGLVTCLRQPHQHICHYTLGPYLVTFRAVVMWRPQGSTGGTDETMQRTCILLKHVTEHVPFLLVVSLPVNLIVIKV